VITVAALLDEGEKQFRAAELFYGHGTENARDEAFAVIYHILQAASALSPDNVLPDTELTAEQVAAIRALFKQRVSTQQPLAYLTGIAYFAGLAFKVDERVIIPRSPMAELIEAQFQPWIGEQAIRCVADLCTGSGCIAIATACYMPDVIVDAIDISEDALSVASENIERHQVAHQVKLFHSDLFEQVPEKKYDVIISNPPYVPAGELEDLPKEYHFEPKLALDGGYSGFDLVDRILKKSCQYLNEQGILIVEIGLIHEQFESMYPGLEVVWLAFARGVSGVLLIEACTLRQYFK